MNNLRYAIPSATVKKSLLVLNLIVAVAYFTWWLNPAHVGQPILFALLFAGEVYHVFMAYLFWKSITPKTRKALNLKDSTPTFPVDIFITVCGEPIDVVKKTVIAAKNIDYPHKHIHILNDSKVAKKPNWHEYEILARTEKINCITRSTPGGAKAGNINNALIQTTGELILIFDADMVAHRDFLTRTATYFSDPTVGFVQTPQYYENSETNIITSSSWEQQKLFFGPIMRGKDSYNASFICGTNVVIRRKALEQVGGMCEDNIAEDFITSFLIHEKGWQSIYVPDVLARGLAPEDLMSYFKQQLRWARGSLEVLFKFNPLFRRGLTFDQKREYLSSALYYLNGLIVLIDITMPLIFLFSGLEPVIGTTTQFAFFFLPFMTLTLYTLYQATDQTLSLRAMSYSNSSWTLQLIALWSIITGKKMSFSVTPKKAQSGNFIKLALPHILYTLIVLVAGGYAIWRDGLTPAVATNISWATFNIVMFLPFIYSAYRWANLLTPLITLQNFLKTIAKKLKLYSEIKLLPIPHPFLRRAYLSTITHKVGEQS
jgi:cellulose synthase (UDP-forming)